MLFLYHLPHASTDLASILFAYALTLLQAVGTWIYTISSYCIFTIDLIVLHIYQRYTKIHGATMFHYDIYVGSVSTMLPHHSVPMMAKFY